MAQLPIESINEVLDMIKGIDAVESIPAPLLFFLRVLPVSQEAGSYALLDSSPLFDLHPPTKSLDSISIVSFVKRWTWGQLFRAINELHIPALELYKRMDPIRCAYFLTKGKFSTLVRKPRWYKGGY